MTKSTKNSTTWLWIFLKTSSCEKKKKKGFYVEEKSDVGELEIVLHIQFIFKIVNNAQSRVTWVRSILMGTSWINVPWNIYTLRKICFSCWLIHKGETLENFSSVNEPTTEHMFSRECISWNTYSSDRETMRKKICFEFISHSVDFFLKCNQRSHFFGGHFRCVSKRL